MMKVNLHTRLDRDGAPPSPHTSQPVYPAYPIDAAGNPLHPLMTIFPAFGYFTPPLLPIAAAQPQTPAGWIPIAHSSSSKHAAVYKTNPSASPGGNDVKQEPPANPLVSTQCPDSGHVLRVRRSTGQRGVPLSEIPVTWVKEEPNEAGVVYREGKVDLDAVRGVVDCPDWCVCGLVPGPTIRLAGIGEEWEGSLVEQPGYPAKKIADPESNCLTFGQLVRLVVEQFLTWWANEKDGQLAKWRSTLEGRQERLPLVPGPATIPLENVMLVAIRRRHIALGVYEWFPEIEVAL